MNFVAFILFSSMEYLAFVYFILALFRFQVKENVIKFIIFSIVLSFVSNTLQMESLNAVSPLVQATLMISFVMFFLRIHIFNALIMVITGYVINFIVTFTIILATMHFSEIEKVIPYTKTAYIVQAASAFMMFMFGWITSIRKGGFSFINNSGRINRIKIFSKENRSFIIFIGVSIILIFMANLWYTISDDVPYLGISIMLFISLIGLLFLSVKRDGQQND